MAKRGRPRKYPLPEPRPEPQQPVEVVDQPNPVRVETIGCYQEIPSVVQEPGDKEAVMHDRRFWPADKPLPDYYTIHRKHRPLACPRCRRVLLDTNSQAVVCRYVAANTAGFRCRNCGNQWSLPLREI